jgi:hypothetical protein
LFSFFAKKVISVDMNKTKSMEELLEKNDKIYFNHMTFSDFLKKDGDTQYDLVYIDGGHDYNSVDNDIESFKGKVKKNGYIGGHDYYKHTFPSHGVVEAVNKHFPDKEILVFSDSSWLVKL